jgi:phage tail sheath protein FI
MVGLGKTMTPLDILEGIMRVQVKLAVVRPAEFIIITYEQEMAKS